MPTFQEHEIIKRVTEAVLITGALTIAFAATRRKIREESEKMIDELKSAPETPRRHFFSEILNGLKTEFMDEDENNLQAPNNQRR